MRLWEIPNWDKGVKVRRSCWEDGVHRIYDNFESVISISDLSYNDWEPYEEPKPKRKVTLWRPIISYGPDEVQISRNWSTKKVFYDTPRGNGIGYAGRVVGWESKVVEIDE